MRHPTSRVRYRQLVFLIGGECLLMNGPTQVVCTCIRNICDALNLPGGSGSRAGSRTPLPTSDIITYAK